MAMKNRFVWFVVLGLVALAVIAARWNKYEPQDGISKGQKIEALTDAVRNGLITQQEYEAKVKEIGGEGGDKYLAAPGEEVRVATDTEQIARLCEALAKGAITREEFDAKLAVFERRRRMEDDLGPDRPRVVRLLASMQDDPLSANKQESVSPVE
jgi:hypothetical protein